MTTDKMKTWEKQQEEKMRCENRGNEKHKLKREQMRKLEWNKKPQKTRWETAQQKQRRQERTAVTKQAETRWRSEKKQQDEKRSDGVKSDETRWDVKNENNEMRWVRNEMRREEMRWNEMWWVRNKIRRDERRKDTRAEYHKNMRLKKKRDEPEKRARRQEKTWLKLQDEKEMRYENETSEKQGYKKIWKVEKIIREEWERRLERRPLNMKWYETGKETKKKSCDKMRQDGDMRKATRRESRVFEIRWDVKTRENKEMRQEKIESG